MHLSKIIERISSFNEIQTNPPVLIDIGASEKLNSVWKAVAPFSICIAFDADKREFDYIEKSDSLFKKQYVFNKIVINVSDKPSQPFYLTHNPYCSSLLKPDLESLKSFHNSDLFQVKEVVDLEVIELKNVLLQLNIKQVDWFKTDSQGTDLRLYKSLSEALQHKVLVLEFEPGFMDAYLGEDKIADVMEYMETQPFFITDMTIKGGLRIPSEAFNDIFKNNLYKKIASHTYKKTPGWAEMVYMNKLNDPEFTSREFILGWLFATLQEHHDVAFSYASTACDRFKDDFFQELKRHSIKKLKKGIFSSGTIMKLTSIFFNKYFTGK